MAVEIKKTPVGGRLKDFVEVVDYIYRGDPAYVRPLDLDLEQRVSLKNPYFDHAEGAIFTAYRNGWCVGRCTAHVDRAHLARHQDDAGFFGFFDTTDDEEVARALLDAATQWVADRGMKRLRGPISLSLNDEVGCLVEGFEHAPMLMMPHHRPYQGALIEKSGFARLKDLLAWRYVVGEVPARARKAHDDVAAMPEVTVRHVDMKNFDVDIHTILDVYNDAWTDNWGHVPATAREAAKMAEALKLLVVPELTYIAEVDGEPAAVAVALPNLNELIQDLDGKLFPIGLPKLLWRLKVKGPKTARLVFLGIRKKLRHVRKYAALSTFLYVKMNDQGRRCGIEWGELSWTLEDNAPMNIGIKLIGGKLYKRYRLYEKAL